MYFGLGWIEDIIPDHAFLVVIVLCALIYLALLALAARIPDLEVDPPDAPITELPRAGPTAVSGLHFLLPIVILMWCILVERLSPALSAFWAAMAMLVVALTQHPLKALMRGTGDLAAAFRRGARECFDGMIAGTRNMIGIAVATGAAGVIVGTISLTGAHQVVGEFVEFLSGGYLMVMLLLVAVMSLILGMGLPTTANYIVVSSLMAPVVVALGAESGLIVPLVAVHMFVFYFGILADDTPPVGVAAFAGRRDLPWRSDQDRRAGLRLRHPHRDPSLPVHLQHRAAPDRRDAPEGARRVPGRGRGDDDVRRGHPGLLRHPQPHLGDPGPAPRRLHAVPPGLLARPGLATPSSSAPAPR